MPGARGRWSVIGLVVAALALVTSAAAQTSPKPQKPMTLTAMDYIEIEQLIAKYSRALDTCTNNGYDYADLYTPDGVFLTAVDDPKYLSQQYLTSTHFKREADASKWSPSRCE